MPELSFGLIPHLDTPKSYVELEALTGLNRSTVRGRAQVLKEHGYVTIHHEERGGGPQRRTMAVVTLTPRGREKLLLTGAPAENTPEPAGEQPAGEQPAGEQPAKPARPPGPARPEKPAGEQPHENGESEENYYKPSPTELDGIIRSALGAVGYAIRVSPEQAAKRLSAAYDPDCLITREDYESAVRDCIRSFAEEA